ncbi:MAG: hypothetical protein ACI35Q_05060 [Marinilabiliaceae bacterium]
MKAFIRILAVVAVLLFCFSATSSAQDGMLDDIKKFTSSSLIYPDGSVFFVDNDGVEKAIPFAMVSVYDKSKGGELAYVSMADRFGHYVIKQYDYTKAFTYVVEAPGFIPDTADVDKLPTKWKDGSPVKGNVTTNFELKRQGDSRPPKPYSLKAYKESEIKVTSDAGGWEGLIRSVPGLKVEDGELVTASGDAVRIKVNDGEMPAEIRKYLVYMPCFMVSDIEVYTLAPGGLYGAVVNIVGSIGQRTTKNFNGYAVFDGR